MNSNELKPLHGAVGMGLEEEGEFKRLEEDMAALVKKLPTLERNIRPLIHYIGFANGTDILSEDGAAFSARISTHTLARSDEIPLFDDVVTNVGSGYDSTSGRFTAAVPGIYFFSVTIRACFHKTVSAALVNGKSILVRLTSGYGGIERTISSISAVVKLNKGEVVYMKQTSEKSGDYYGYGFTTFSGIMFD